MLISDAAAVASTEVRSWANILGAWSHSPRQNFHPDRTCLIGAIFWVGTAAAPPPLIYDQRNGVEDSRCKMCFMGCLFPFDSEWRRIRAFHLSHPVSSNTQRVVGAFEGAWQKELAGLGKGKIPRQTI